MDNTNKGKELFEDIPIPENLLPENIVSMLNESKNNSVKSKKEKSKEILVSTNIQPSVIRPKKKRKITKTLAAIAACAVLVTGVVAIMNNQDNDNYIFKGEGYSFVTELSRPKDYSDVYQAFQKIYTTSDSNHYTLKDFFSGIFNGNKSSATNSKVQMDAAPSYDMVEEEALDTNETETSKEFSETHQQVEGVAEADIIKTDGNRIYYVANSILYIVETNEGEMTLLSKIEKENIFAKEIYLVDNKIILISDKYTLQDAPKINSKGIYDDAMPEMESVLYPDGTQVEVIDTTDGANPKTLSSYFQKGNYVSSRMIGNNVYLASSYKNYNSEPIDDENDIEKFIPTYQVNDETSYIAPENISIPEKCDNTNYTIISGLDITAENPLVSIQALLGYDGIVYSSLNNYYVAGAKWGDNKQQTTIARFSIDKGNIQHTGFGVVDGVILNQFSMDEYEGNFRIATTKYNYKTGIETNGVYVLDKDMKQIGKLTGLAENETIRSVRFDKETGYVVTFEQTDPLFTIDLSDPTKPTVSSELKINGYSSYLINYGEGKLLGFGIDADDNGTQTGLKLSMFSITDGEDVKEITSKSLGDDLQWAYSVGVYDHKALLIDPEKNIIGIPVQFFDGIDNCNRYYVFKYSDEKGFEEVGKIETFDMKGYFQFNRGMYIDDVVYAFAYGRIVSAKLSDMSIISTIELLSPTEKSKQPYYLID